MRKRSARGILLIALFTFAGLVTLVLVVVGVVTSHVATGTLEETVRK